MPREGVTLAQVEEAMEELENEQQPTSYRRIRAKLGEGSLTTIANHVREVHRQRQIEAAPLDEDRPALPDPVVKALFAGADRTWNELLEASEDIIADAQARCDEDVQLKDATVQQAIELRDEAENDNKRLSDELAHTQSELSVLTKTYNRISEDHRALQTKNERVLGELEVHQDNNKQLNARLKAADHQNERLSDKVLTTEKASKDEIARLVKNHTKQLADVRATVDEKEALIQSLTNTNASATTSIEHLERSLRNAEASVKEVRTERNQANSALDAMTKQRSAAETQLAAESEKLAAARTLLERQEAESALLIASKDEHIQDLTALVDELRRELTSTKRGANKK